MVLQTKHLTLEEFDRLIALPENADKLFEYIDGEVLEVPSNPYASRIAGLILAEIVYFLKGKDLGYVTGEAGGYVVSGERYAPDVAFISKQKQPQLAQEGYNPKPPDLAVEVDFPSSVQSQRTLRTKVHNYVAAGTVVWVVLPEEKEVEVYVSGQPKKTVKIDGVLDGADVLPGFSLPVKEIFPD